MYNKRAYIHIKDLIAKGYYASVDGKTTLKQDLFNSYEVENLVKGDKAFHLALSYSNDDYNFVLLHFDDFMDLIQ